MSPEIIAEPVAGSTPPITPTVEISARAASQVSRGQLWIFSNEVRQKVTALAPGTWCWFTHRGRITATGYINSHSLISGRAVALDCVEDIPALLAGRLKAAFERRASLFSNGSARLVYSEADLLPGLIVDWFSDQGAAGGTAVLQSSTAGMDRQLDELERLVPKIFQEVFGVALSGLVVRADSGIRRLEGVEDFSRVVLGSEKDLKQTVFSDNGVRYAADLLAGQKTGFFLDQRLNRSYLMSHLSGLKGKRVLDLFSYSGGWGLAALKAGASHVTFVDSSAPALELAKRGLELNGFEASSARTVIADIFEFLEANHETFDVVVVDPPAFVKSKKNLPQAASAYEKLNRLSWRALRDGGLLLTCSCSYHLPETDFIDILRSAIGKEVALAHMLYRGFQPSDHPVLLSMPETNYLKCVGLRKVAWNKK